VSAAIDGLCFGIDVGGTFTDCVLTEGASTWRAKASTTPGEIGKGVLAAVTLAAERRGQSLAETLPKVARFGLGTTAVTNVLAARTGRKVGLITTSGFEEMLPFSRGTRILDADGWVVTPPSLVPREAIEAISERVDRNGAILVPIDECQVEAAVRRLVEEQRVEAIAVSFLWSFLNMAHERLVIATIARLYPKMTAVSAGELHPVAREYERTSYAVLNAYVTGALAGIDELAGKLAAMGMPAPLLLVHSAGGSISVAEAKQRPLVLAASGPAAGVAASVAVAMAAGFADVITCDLGGTSFDVSVVEGGLPARRTRGEILGMWTALPLIDVESIGAGGGSLGWVDARGALRVGPRSAGAVPGPACYGRGGTQATVTDALVVLGYIDADRFLGGDFKLDPQAAHAACATLGEALGLDAETAAWGIRRLALADMVKATRGRTGALGLDPRKYALLSFGGSGSLFSPDIALAVGARRVLVPELASVLSAFGAATTDIRRERIRAVLLAMPVDPARVAAIKADLDQTVRADLDADGVPGAAQSIAFEVDMRFAKQIFELALPLPAGPFDAAAADALISAFDAEYRKRYGQGAMVLGATMEMVAMRGVGTGKTTQAQLVASAGETVITGTRAVPGGRRSVRIERGGAGRREVATYDGSRLRPGHALAGPALIDSRDTTIWLPEAMTATVNPQGTLVMETI